MQSFSSYSTEAQRAAYEAANLKAQGKPTYILSRNVSGEKAAEYTQAYNQLLRENSSIKYATQQGTTYALLKKQADLSKPLPKGDVVVLSKEDYAQRQTIKTPDQLVQESKPQTIITTTDIPAQVIEADKQRTLTPQQFQEIRKQAGIKEIKSSKLGEKIYNFFNEPATVQTFSPIPLGKAGKLKLSTIKKIAESSDGKVLKYSSRLIPETKGGALAFTGVTVGGTLSPPIVGYAVSAPLTGVSIAKRTMAVTPEEKTAANIGIVLAASPLIFGGIKTLTTPKPTIRTKIVRQEVVTPDGQKFIIEKVIPKETLSSKSTLAPVQLQDKGFNIGRFSLTQEIPQQYGLKGQSVISDILFSRKQVILSKGKVVTIKPVNPLLIDEKGAIVNDVLVSSRGKYGLLRGTTAKISASEFKQLPKEIKNQFLKAYEFRTGIPISENRFMLLLKSSKDSLSVSAVEYQKILKATTTIPKDISKYTKIVSNGKTYYIRAEKAGKTITRSSLTDQSKLEIGGDTLPYEIYSSKTMVRKTNFPTEKISSIKVLRTIESKTKVLKQQTTQLLPDDLFSLDKPVQQVQKQVTKQIKTIQSTEQAVVSGLLSKPKPAKIPTTKTPPVKSLVLAPITSVLISQPTQAQFQRPISKQFVKETNITSVLTGSSQAQKTNQRQTPRQTQNEIQAQKTNQRQNNLQRQDIIQKTIPRETLIEQLVKTPSGRTLTAQRIRPRITPTTKIPPFVFSLDNKKQPIRKINLFKTPKRTSRGYSLTASIGNILTGQRRARPKRLSQITGFESLTI